MNVQELAQCLNRIPKDLQVDPRADRIVFSDETGRTLFGLETQTGRLYEQRWKGGAYRVINLRKSPEVTPKFPRFFVYTSKAVRHGCPANRVFLVVAQENLSERSTTPHLVAWKCEITSGGKFEHPAWRKALPLTREGVLKGASDKTAHNGAEPTALFKPDSYYREIALADVITLKYKGE